MIRFKVRISLIYYSIWSRRWNSFMQLQVRKPHHSLERRLQSNQMQLFLHFDRCSPILDLIEERQRREEQGNLEWSLHPSALTDPAQRERLPGSGSREDKEAVAVGDRKQGKRNPHSEALPGAQHFTRAIPQHLYNDLSSRSYAQEVKWHAQGHTASRDLKPVGLTSKSQAWSSCLLTHTGVHSRWDLYTTASQQGQSCPPGH